ncbi:helix-turn-helix domain-containing protein [Streptomyces sp. NPDC001493]
MPSTEDVLRLTIGALMRLTGERQADLADGIGLSQTQISRKQAGTATWSLADVDRLSAHYGIPVPDLLAGVDRAVHCLPVRRRAPAPGAAQLTISP